jgi:hypothetical protein
MTERDFLGKYFQAMLDRLEADALLYNRELPHRGIVGALNESAIADVLREFLPSRFALEENALIIDHRGGQSRECDIVICDHSMPKYFRKIFPIERVFAIIEVKTSLTSTTATEALAVFSSVNQLDFRPQLTPYWESRSLEHYRRFLATQDNYNAELLPKLMAQNEAEGRRHLEYQDPPMNVVFGYRTDAVAFETFSAWFTSALYGDATRPTMPEIREFLACALDQGIVHCTTGDGFVRRFAACAGESRKERGLRKQVRNVDVSIDPAKSLFLFLEQLWLGLSRHRMHPGFDIRAYMNDELGQVIPVDCS